MTPEAFNAAVDVAVATYAAQAGEASALKRGRNPAFPYVPVILHPHPHVKDLKGRTEQVLGRAFAVRDDAVACAQHVLKSRVAFFRSRLLDPNCRAAREQWGLPRELPPIDPTVN